jgi:hypothetical protein
VKEKKTGEEAPPGQANAGAIRESLRKPKPFIKKILKVEK